LKYAACCCEAFTSLGTKMDLFRRRMQGRAKLAGSGTHLDADTLAAFAEGSQCDGEEAAVFAHLAECQICREYLSVQAELNDFHWSSGKPQDRSLSRSWSVSRSLRTAAGVACAVATLWLLSSSPPRPPVAIATSKGPVKRVPAAMPIDRPPMIGVSKRTVTKKSGDRSLSAVRLNMRSMPVRNFTAQAPRNIAALWGSAALQKLSTGDRLAARNSHRFREEVTLASVSFEGKRTAGEGDGATLDVNQIALKTQFGDRRITVEGFWKASRGREGAPTDLQ